MEKINKHVISAGGFIFYLDKETKTFYTVLIENNKGEFWIPKGKKEGGESLLDTAKREIHEEVGFETGDLIHVGFCYHDDYIYQEQQQTIRKELDIHTFIVKMKFAINPIDKNNIRSIDWYRYEDAHKIINFNKTELEKAYEMTIEYYETHNARH